MKLESALSDHINMSLQSFGVALRFLLFTSPIEEGRALLCFAFLCAVSPFVLPAAPTTYVTLTPTRQIHNIKVNMLKP